MENGHAGFADVAWRTGEHSQLPSPPPGALGHGCEGAEVKSPSGT